MLFIWYCIQPLHIAHCKLQIVLPTLCPLFKTKVGNKKLRNYAVLWTFCPLSHFFFKTNAIKNFSNIYKVWRKKWASGQPPSGGTQLCGHTQWNRELIARSQTSYYVLLNFNAIYKVLQATIAHCTLHIAHCIQPLHIVPAHPLPTFKNKSGQQKTQELCGFLDFLPTFPLFFEN